MEERIRTDTNEEKEDDGDDDDGDGSCVAVGEPHTKGVWTGVATLGRKRAAEDGRRTFRVLGGRDLCVG